MLVMNVSYLEGILVYTSFDGYQFYAIIVYYLHHF